MIPIVNPGTPLYDHLQRSGFDPATIHSRDYFDPRAIFKLTRLFRQQRVSSVHVHRTQDLAVVLAAAGFADVNQRVLTLRMESKHRKKDLYHRWVYSRLTSVLTLTERMQRLVRQHVAVNPDKVRVLRNGYDFEKLRSEAESSAVIRARWKIPENAFIVGIVGRLEPGKGQYYLLKAGKLLQGEIPHLHLMIVGEETVNLKGEAERLRRIALELDLSDRVVFTGYQHPPGVVVPAFDIAVLASKKETFGNVLVEAMALEVPVIGTNAGGVPEIITDGENGLLVPPEDPAALAEAILLLYHEHQLRRRFSETGLKTVQSRYSLESHITGLEKSLGIN